MLSRRAPNSRNLRATCGVSAQTAEGSAQYDVNQRGRSVQFCTFAGKRIRRLGFGLSPGGKKLNRTQIAWNKHTDKTESFGNAVSVSVSSLMELMLPEVMQRVHLRRSHGRR